MDQLKWFDRVHQPLVIAHRGASLEAPENTIAAFHLAIKQGAEAIELDVTKCESGEIIVIHDTTVDRTTDGTGEVASLPLNTIRTLDAGSWFGSAFEGETIPTLDEVFESVGQKTYINIELKNHTTPFDNLAEIVAQVVKKHNLQERVFLSSFNPLNFWKIKRHLPGSPMGLLTIKGKAGQGYQWLGRLIGPYDVLHPHYSDVSAQYIERAHQSGMPVFAYTINDAQKIQQLVSAGLDGVITDNPVLAQEAILQNK